MYAVIFRATIRQFNADYEGVGPRLRELAFAEYNCVDFHALVDGDQEIAVSYWRSEDDIRRWRASAEHQLAQQQGRDRWYSQYTVQVLRLEREYSSTVNRLRPSGD